MTMQPHVPPGPPVQVLPKSPALAVGLSLLVPGLGSMTSGRVSKGVLILVSYVISWLLCFVLIGLLTTPIVWIWGMVAAHGDARKWNYDHGIMS